MKNNVFAAMFFVIFCISCFGVTVQDVVQAYPRPGYLPAASDVSIRSLNFRPMNEDDDQDTLEAIRAFHATRLEWVYLRFNEEEKELIDRVKRMGCVFGASGEPGTAVKVELAAGREYVANAIEFPNGDPVYLVHSKDWLMPIYPGCMNNPVYLKKNVEYYVKNVEYGAEVLQRDNPESQRHFATTAKGCFCKYCMEGFREYLRENMPESRRREIGIADIDTFNYRDWLYENDLVKNNTTLVGENALFWPFVDYQKKSSIRFFSDLRTAINVLCMKRVPFSRNNTSHQEWDSPSTGAFDFAISEILLEFCTPAHLYDRACTARKLGQLQVFGTPKSMGKQYTQTELNPLKRLVISTAYASGALARVPWDMFEDTRDGKGRYFGKPEHFADLYAFVRAAANYLDGYEDAGAFGPDIEEDRYGETVPVKIDSDSEQVYAFVRAVPGDTKKPVVVHLVDWNERQDGFDVLLRKDCFFDGAELEVTMLRPAAYDAKQHKQAWEQAQEMLGYNEKLSARQASAYTKLAVRIVLPVRAEGGYVRCRVPAIDPWAILAVTPAK